MFTPVMLVAYFVTLGPVVGLPIRDSVTQPPVGFVVVPAQPIPREFAEPAWRAEWMQQRL